MVGIICRLLELTDHLLLVSLGHSILAFIFHILPTDSDHSMGVMAHSPPNYQIIAASEPAVLPDINHPAPIFYYAGLPPGLTLPDNVNGLMNAVFSFGGATLFCELMAEMRRP